jgi:serine/threonine-protein kinase
LRETRIAACLRHPRVVQILDHGIAGDVPYIAMGLLAGENLSRRLMRLGPLPLSDVNQVLQQTAEVLTHARQLGEFLFDG